MKETKYHRIESCNKCGGLNNKEGKSTNEYEIYTKCNDCGYEDFWAYGFFESSCDGLDNCKKYVNRGGRLVDL